MSEFELIQRISKLEAQNHALVVENRCLREKLGYPQEESVQECKEISDEAGMGHTESSIAFVLSKYSSPKEKIELFLSLFRGRTDVYAKRCYSKKHQSSYYIPA